VTSHRARIGALVALGAAALGATGCGAPLGMGGLMGGGSAAPFEAPDMNRVMAKQQIMQEVMNNPDTPAWHEQREKLALAMGDRVFDKDFNRVFDSLTVAIASLGSRVQNMERQSGYIAASAPSLPPARQQALSHEGMQDYVRQKGYDPRILEKQGQYDTFDVESIAGMQGRYASGMTVSMVRQAASQTKVKIRFDNIYYPRLVEEYYKIVWATVDKQIFLDKGLD
jgi:hypothetical protein